MPFYEYECSNCKFYTEVMQKISDAPLTECPSCGEKALVKLVSAPNFRLKGGGWYETDFKGDKENKRNLAVGDAPSESGAPSAETSKAGAKAEGAKAEGAKTEAASSDSSSKPAPVSASGESKASSSRRSSVSRPAAKPASRAPAEKVRVAASKAKPVPSRSKPKPAAKKKKARR